MKSISEIIRTTKTVTRQETVTMEIKGEDFVALLHAVGINVPADASVTILVPGGDDWSNTELDLSGNPITIMWQRTSTE
jgi:hypothetical protein